MIEVQGKGNIKVRIIADSISAIDGKRITTFELEYPRFIHSELMTHRLFSRNAASSRAIPVQKLIDLIEEAPAMPVHWGKNQPGMKAKEELDENGIFQAKYLWKKAAHYACKIAGLLNGLGAHKQIVNRTLEPFQMMKTVLTATEFDNWYWLRKHSDAQPEINELAALMYEAQELSEPEVLQPGEWHTPYVAHYMDFDDAGNYTGIRYCLLDYDDELEDWFPGKELTLEQALKVSSSCCAQVSYRVLDDSLEKALDIYQKLVDSEPVHASPFEHQATPMQYNTTLEMIRSNKDSSNHNHELEEGVTHVDRNGNLWSGNFKSWIQHRQLIPNNACWEYSA